MRHCRERCDRYISRAFFVPFLFLFLGISCCSERSAHFVYTGRIDEDLVTKVTNASDSYKINELRLTSTGGDVRASVRLARYLNEKHIRLRIKDYCFSACAGILALTVEDVIIEPGTLVALHGGPLAHLTIRSYKGPLGDVASIKGLQLLYEERSVPGTFSVSSLEALGPLCFQESAQGPIIYSRATLWVATKSELAALGVRTPPGWPEKYAPVMQGIMALFKSSGKAFLVSFNVKFRGEPKVFNLKECDAATIASATPGQ